MKQYYRFTLTVLGVFLSCLLTNAQPLRVNTMPSWITNHAESNFQFNDTILIWGTAFGGTPPYSDTLKIDGVWIPNSSLFADNDPVIDPLYYVYGHFFSRRLVFYSCGFHTVSLKVTDAAGNTASSQSTILIHNNPPFDIKVDMVIERGLLYLFKHAMNYTGNMIAWTGYDGSAPDEGSYSYASTASSILAFEENSHFYHDDSLTDPFAVMLKKGMDYLFDPAGQQTIYNHDDGTGLKISDVFTDYVSGATACSTGHLKGSCILNNGDFNFTYANAFGLMAAAISQTDSLSATVNLISHGCFAGWTYMQFLKDALDYVYFYQGDFAERGGWYYTQGNSLSYDGSLEQWNPLFMAAMEARLDVQSPDWVKTNTVHAYSLITNANGGCGYTDPYSTNTAKTGGMLVSFAWAGKFINNGDPEALAAFQYLETHFPDMGSTGWDAGWLGNFYAMYAVKKGLALQNVQFINYNGQPRDWYHDMVGWLTAEQLSTLPPELYAGNKNLNSAYGQFPDGSWKDLFFSNYTALSTAHAILVLTPNIFEAPVPNPTPVTGICQGDSTQVSSTPGVSYEWFSSPSGYYSTLTSPYVHPDSTTVYFAFVYDTLGCILEVDSVRVIIWPTTDPQAYYNNPLCTGDTLQLFSQPGWFHSWTGPNGFTSNLQLPAILMATPSMEGWYYIMMNDTNHCLTFDSLQVSVHSLPAANATGNTPVCTNDSLLLHGTGGAGYVWSGPSAFTAIGPDPVIHGFQMNMTGQYVVTVTSEFACTSIDSVLITGLVSPVAATSSNSPVCVGDTLTMTAQGGTSYSWTGPGIFISTLPQIDILNVQLTQIGTYRVVVKDNNQCKDTAFLSILVRQSPFISDVQFVSPTCHSDSNGTIQLTVSGGPPFNYDWNCCPGINSPTMNNLCGGWYIVTVTNTEGCWKTDTIHLIQPEPFIISSVVTPDTCKGLGMGSISITSITGQNPPYDFTWSSGNTGSSAVNLTYGDYSVTINDMHGCDSIMPFTVGYLSDPKVSVVPDSIDVCTGDTILLVASGCINYEWSPVWWLSQSTGYSTEAFPQQSTTFSVVGSDFYHCRDTATALVRVIPLPEIDLGGDIWLAFGEQTVLNAPFGYSQYLWSTGSTGQAIIVKDTGTYWLRIRNTLCTNSDTMHVYEITDIWVPNAFTPDNDGKNDYFCPVCTSCTEMEFQVYNRWGEVVFESNSTEGRWNGTFKGSPAPDGVYVYRIRFHKPSPQHYDGTGVLRGIVTLLR